ncbi:citrate synthase [Halomicroarcula sp. F13]|uniref:Citrate synthase n=1 Tax=Haloarcula rubra TaxID=2487747 RepID=A0AAW4PV45_9EURY|nr:citrate synthase [Halomicroarcula rubra]MBX0324375.1 citrate synthase [Halomicroarcula rubra]
MTGPVSEGLDGIAVGETEISQIDGSTGSLAIRGYPIAEVAQEATYEETVFLLLYGRLPTAEELTGFRKRIASNREISNKVKIVIEQAAQEEKSAMDALRMGVAGANLGHERDNPEADAIRLIAVFPTIVAAYWRYRQGKDPIAPRQDLRHAANYLYMLTGEKASEARIEGVETYLNTVADHGLNASTFTARVVVSTQADLVSAGTAAVGALKGPLHGGAPGPVLEMLRTVNETGNPADYVRSTLAGGDRLMGFGHRVYRTRDPRAAVLEDAAHEFYTESDDADLFETAREFEEVAVELLAERVPDRRLETNVEFYTAVLLAGVGVPKELFTTTFAISRVSGWMAHALEQLDDNRLIRPTAHYTGEIDRSWTAIAER